MQNRWNNKDDFSVALKAAAWEAQLIRRHRSSSSDPMVCSIRAAEKMGIADEKKPVANVDEKILFEVVYVLAFVDGNDAFVDHEIGRAWLEYAGMGTKAKAA